MTIETEFKFVEYYALCKFHIYCITSYKEFDFFL